MALAHTAIEVERHYGAPDMEFALDDHHIWIVQSRPITTLDRPPAGDAVEMPGTLLVSGLAAAPGGRLGVVRILRSPADGRQLLPGEVLVAPMTNPDWVPTMRRAAALVTDGGGVTCHAAIVGRELHLPTVVATRNMASVLRDGEMVTVDGTAGEVREGREPAPGPAGAAGRGRRSRPGPTGRHGDPAVREPGHRRPRRGRRRRCPSTASGSPRRVHDHRRPRGGAPPAHAGDGAARRVRAPHGDLCRASRGLRSPTGDLPGGRLPHQRVPGPDRWRGVRASKRPTR